MRKKLLSILIATIMACTTLCTLSACITVEEGTQWHYGDQAPGVNIIAESGDMYLDAANGLVYTLTSDGWVLVGDYSAIDGANGADGADGANGADGADGVGIADVDCSYIMKDGVRYIVFTFTMTDGSIIVQEVML